MSSLYNAEDLLVVGGGVSDLLDLMQPHLAAVPKERLLPGFRPADIRTAALGDTAGLVGAAVIAHGGAEERDGSSG